MEEKVEALEAAAEASAELSLLGSSTVTDLETEFQLLEASSQVDEEFEKMKRDLKLLGGTTEMAPESRKIPIKTSEKVSLR